MKKLLLFLPFLLFNSFLSFAAEKPNPVLDTDGDEIRPGVAYYVVSAIWGAGGGGVTYGLNTGNETCPLAVVQAGWDINQGSPVTFTPVNWTEDVVRVSTDLNIKFAFPILVCTESSVWKLDFHEELKQHFIVTNGVAGNPGYETIDNWFKIEKLGFGYKLVFCPTVCNTTKVICKDVGRFFYDGARRLALSDDLPFWVVFKKAQCFKNENILKSVTSA